MIRSARDLSPDEKQAIEGLLGRRISDEEEISIRALGAHKGVAPEAACGDSYCFKGALCHGRCTPAAGIGAGSG
jgi:hypothetical protein